MAVVPTGVAGHQVGDRRALVRPAQVHHVDPGLSGRGLLASVAEHRGTAGPALDVPDPYGQGPEVAEACAAAIEDLLRVVVPALTGSRIIAP